MADAIATIITALAGFGMPVLIFYFFYLAKCKRLETIIKLVELGGEVKPEVLKMLEKPRGPKSDLRKGLIWLAIGFPLTAGIAIESGFGEAVIGTIPIFIGVAYLVIMKYGHDETTTNNTQRF